MNPHEFPLGEGTVYHKVSGYSWWPILCQLPPQTRRQEAKTSDSSVIMACHGDQLEEWPNKMFALYVDITYLFVKKKHIVYVV